MWYCSSVAEPQPQRVSEDLIGWDKASDHPEGHLTGHAEVASPGSRPHESRPCPGNKAILSDKQCFPVACGLPHAWLHRRENASLGEPLRQEARFFTFRLQGVARKVKHKYDSRGKVKRLLGNISWGSAGILRRSKKKKKRKTTSLLLLVLFLSIGL